MKIVSKKKSIIGQLRTYFSVSERLMRFNGIILFVAFLGNTFFQAFCVPTNWAVIVISICFLNTTMFPIWLKSKKYEPIVSFINGVSACLFLYCIIFLGWMNMVGFFLVLLGVGLLTFIPHFLFIQLIWKGLIKPSSQRAKQFFIIGVLVSMTIPISSYVLYQKALRDIEVFNNSDYQELNKSFMTEKILGMGFIYHVRICGYDGWRPPLHEPLLVIGQWFNRWEDPLDISLINRVELYKINFPDRKIKFNCSCSFEGSREYHNDDLWK